MDSSGRRRIQQPMQRPGHGKEGRKIQLFSNHFKVDMVKSDVYIFQYHVTFKLMYGGTVDNLRNVGWKILDEVRRTHPLEMGSVNFAYDGDAALFTVGALCRNKLEFYVELDHDHILSSRIDALRNPGVNGSPSISERIWLKHQFFVEITYADHIIPMRFIADALSGRGSAEGAFEAIRVLNVVLRQHAVKQGCLLVRQSAFHNQADNLRALDGGVLGCRGFRSSFRATQSGLSLNLDASHTTIVEPGPVVDFLMSNQNVQDPRLIDWKKAKSILRNLRIVVEPSNSERKIRGLSKEVCRNQRFLLKRPGQRDGDEPQQIELNVYDFFLHHRKIELCYSGDLPCIDVGSSKRPTYIPIELCSLLPLQRYTKELTVYARSLLVEKSRESPRGKMTSIEKAMTLGNYSMDPMIQACGIVIHTDFTRIEGRVLDPPLLKFGHGEDVVPENGRWNIRHKALAEPSKVQHWAVVNFSACCDTHRLINALINVGEMKGISVDQPLFVVEEEPQFRQALANVRVDRMCDQFNTFDKPRFILCILADRKHSKIYGPWKRKMLIEDDFGICNQCIAPTTLSEQYISNLLLKINVKRGGLNFELALKRNIPIFHNSPTIIFGMHVSHSYQHDFPSIAAVVSSRSWPSVYRYRASMRSQTPQVNMIESLVQRTSDGKDNGIFRELLNDFYATSHSKPSQIIIFRDGVSESQFNQVLNTEFKQILEACELIGDESWSPKFTIVVAQKDHHTKFIQANKPENIPPGTVVDTGVCHPKSYDFYLCAHAGTSGTSRPTHYHVLLDQIGFSPDELQELIHSLCYVCQRSTTAISTVAPIRYAHLAASQALKFLNYEDIENANGLVPDLPKLHKNVRSSMFFC